jgi:hypothetical protein
MPALAALADEARLPGPDTDGLPGLASFRARYPGYDATAALDALRASEYWCLDAEGQTYLDYTGAGLPARDTAAAGISVRTGCFCNPGAAEAAFGLTRSDVARARWLDAGSTDSYMKSIGVPGGAIRASVGLASNIEYVEKCLALLETTYRDRPPSRDR